MGNAILEEWNTTCRKDGGGLFCGKNFPYFAAQPGRPEGAGLWRWTREGGLGCKPQLLPTFPGLSGQRVTEMGEWCPSPWSLGRVRFIVGFPKPATEKDRLNMCSEPGSVSAKSLLLAPSPRGRKGWKLLRETLLSDSGSGSERAWRHSRIICAQPMKCGTAS